MISNQKILFVIGAQKAGTTWLREALYSQDKFSIGPIKELHYYTQFSKIINHDWCKQHRLEQLNNAGNYGKIDNDVLLSLNNLEPLSTASYLSLLQFNEDKYFIDFSVEYSILEPEIFETIISDFPNCKFLYILREPVERALSQIRMQNICIHDLEHILQIEANTNIISQSKYFKNISKILSVVNEEKLLVLDFREIILNPIEFLNKISIFFLGEELNKATINENNLRKPIFSNKQRQILNHELVKNILQTILEDETNYYTNIFNID